MTNYSEIKPLPAFMKASDAAHYLGISRRFLHSLSKSGRIPYAKLGPKCLLYRRTDLNAVVDAATIGK